MRQQATLPLRPTLWRTCRVLASERRLRLLRTLADGRHSTVKALAEELGWPATTATINIHHVTAFTHPRRIRIVQTIGDDERSGYEVRRMTGISRDAFRRHLEKLVSRGYLVTTARGIRCTRPRHALPRTLLHCARGS